VRRLRLLIGRSDERRHKCRFGVLAASFCAFAIAALPARECLHRRLNRGLRGSRCHRFACRENGGKKLREESEPELAKSRVSLRLIGVH
jgi:hypothetical protein